MRVRRVLRFVVDAFAGDGGPNSFVAELGGFVEVTGVPELPDADARVCSSASAIFASKSGADSLVEVSVVEFGADTTLLRFNFVFRWLDHRPCIDLLRAFEPFPHKTVNQNTLFR